MHFCFSFFLFLICISVLRLPPNEGNTFLWLGTSMDDLKVSLLTVLEVVVLLYFAKFMINQKFPSGAACAKEEKHFKKNKKNKK